jgi:glyoxylase-like metal-dependent hydrolase (beta-lactamase superfamily II)
VLIESRGARAVITGDLMHNPIQIAIPATEARFDMDKPQAARTRCDFVQRFSNSDTLVIGSHFPEPTAGHIVSDGTAWKLKL